MAESSTPTLEQLKVGAGGVSYRAEQVANVALLLTWFPGLFVSYIRVAVTNSFVESALINSRVLAWFLDEKQPGKDTAYLHSGHFLQGWEHDVATQTRGVIEVTSDYLAHARLGDPEGEEHPGAWPIAELAVVLVGGLSDLVCSLDASRRAYFAPNPQTAFNRLLASDVLARPTKPSRNPRTAELTRSLQEYLTCRELMVDPDQGT